MISGKRRSALLAAISLVGGTISYAQATDARGPAPVLVGMWESQTSGNAYRMRVIWNPTAGRYEGRLVAQGHASQNVGFPLGELCWTATPSQSSATLNIFEEFRSGRVGRTSNVTWRPGLLYLDRSTPGQLLTSVEAFRRIAETPSGDTTPGATSFPNLAMFPTADQVRQRITGRDPLDTAARQFAALKTLANILNAVRVANQDERRASYAIYSTYSEGQGLARRQFGAAGEPLAQSYLHDEKFAHDITHLVFPDVGKYVDAKAKVIADAQAAARAEAEAKAAERAAAKARAEADEAAAAAAAEAARRVEVHVSGNWTAAAPYVTGLYDCKSARPHAVLVQISQEGTALRATMAEGNDCVPAKALLWEGELPQATLTVGDLPFTMPVQVFAVAKGSKRKKLPQPFTLRIKSADMLAIDELDFPANRGDQRKSMTDQLVAFIAKQKHAPRLVDMGAAGFNLQAYEASMNEVRTRMENDRKFYEREDYNTRQNNYDRQQEEWNRGGCSDCGGVAPTAPYEPPP